MKLCLIVSLFFVGLIGSIQRVRADLVFVSGSRTVFSAATYGAPDIAGTTAGGTFSDSASTLGAGPGGTHSASATQTSTAPMTTGPLMTGIGSALSTISATGLDGYSTTGESVFIVNFQVDADAMYSFDASTNWVGDAPPFGGGVNNAFVELKDVPTSTQLAFVTSAWFFPGLNTLSSPVFLETGTTYRLTAHAGVSGGGGLPGAFTASSDWLFDLTPAAIPEVGSVVMMTVATFGIVVGAWWAHRRQHCKLKTRDCA